ncbi:unnamed protein product [Caenorhabditis nigoni]
MVGTNSIKQVTELLKSKEYVQCLKEAYHSDIIIDPLERGNFTRFFNHSCQPNLTIVKVCAGGVSPLNLNLVFIANTNRWVNVFARSARKKEKLC